jgi:hypothetical protein
VPSFLFVGGFRLLYDIWGYTFAPLPLAPAIAYYTVMQRSSTRTRWVISVALLAGVVVGQLTPGHNEPYDFFVQVFIFAATGVTGVLSRGRLAYLSQMQERADRAETERDRQAALAAAGERARIASRQALTELRRLLGVLRGPGQLPQAAPSPSLGDLGGVLDQVRGAGLMVALTVTGEAGALGPGVELAAYRIVQEALTNALRQAAAPAAAVSLRYEPGYVTVSVTDTGPPCAAAGRPRGGELPGGFGLAGITERVASCGGTLTVGPTAAGGFAVTARLPAL